MTLLNEIQQKLKAPKGQFNSFGKYNYRNCEDILEAVKPLLGDKGVLTLSDEIVQLGDRFYVKATAALAWEKGGVREAVSTHAYAREAADKKGMDEAQITGAASSYARKYALSGLFCIDDGKDADSDAPAPVRAAQAPAPKVTQEVTRPKVVSTGDQVLKARIKELVDAQVINPLTEVSQYHTYIKEVTKLDFKPENLQAIIKKLEAMQPQVPVIE